MLRKNSGITLITLVITIVLLLILAGTATFTGMSAVENSEITTFKAEMKMMREQLNSESELQKYEEEVRILTNDQEKYLLEVKEAIENDLSITLEMDGFKYFTKDDIKVISGIDISRNLYINASTKTIVSGEGVKYDGKTYYMLEQLSDSLYNVEEDEQKNSGDVDFEVAVNNLKITVSGIKYGASYVNKGTIQYKLATEDEWTTVAQNTTSRNLTFEVAVSGDYNIKVVDAKENEKTIDITLAKTVLEYAKDAMPTKTATIIETDETKGIVMQDDNENEWVWIEVPDSVFSETTKTNPTSENIEADLIEYAKDYRNGSSTQTYSWTDEWYALDGDTLVTASTGDLTSTQKALNNGCGLTYDEYNTNYNKMLTSIYENKGFYIARYEAGIAGSDEDTTLARYSHADITSTSTKAVSKQNMIPYNFIYCSEAQYLASNMKTGTKTSSLMFGIQWDLVCKFLEVNVQWSIPEGEDGTYYIKSNSASWGNTKDSGLTLSRGKYYLYSATSWTAYNTSTTNYVKDSIKVTNSCILLTTGASEGTNKMNIYDFAGNEWEFTLEHTSNTDRPCALSGSSCIDASYYYSAFSSYNFPTIAALHNVGFRSSLY